MRIDRSKAKRGTTDVPPDCKALIERLKGCGATGAVELALIQVLEEIKVWTFGKCELYHWIDVLDLFDSILQKATQRKGVSWAMACDIQDEMGHVLQLCVRKICSFTALLIEHSFSRTVYNSMEHLAALLNSNSLSLVLEVLQLLYMFSKRSNFLTRLAEDKRSVLLGRLALLAESWGGKEAGFGLAACCLQRPLEDFPTTATTVHLEFAKTSPEGGNRWKQSDMWQVIHIENVHTLPGTPAEILDEIVARYQVPAEKQLVLFTHIRLAYNFPKYNERVQLIQARLQALSILVYANAIQDNTQQLLYNGLMEELVDVLELEQSYLTDIKAAALKTLTSIIHLDRAQNFPSIVEATGAGSYHGFLPVMVRACISSLTSSDSKEDREPYPLPLATALFSFLYHLASYEVGGEALVNCGILESLLKVVNWNTDDVEHITFVTRAVRVIDLITNMDMQAFQAQNGLTSFINRLEMEINACRKDQPFEIVPRKLEGQGASSGDEEREDTMEVPMDTDVSGSQTDLSSDTFNSNVYMSPNNAVSFVHNGTSCLTQRAALLKSMLNFLKKVIQDQAFSDNIRHIMEGPLPNALKHIISNAEYYGASLFILATDVVTVYVFQEPSLLSTLQDSRLTDIITEALVVKDVPPTREVIATMPNIFSALCLNNRGLNSFIKYHPFNKLFRMLISAEYLPAMRRRRTTEPMGDTASNLGNAVDELMRHQPSLRPVGLSAMVELLEELSNLGSSPRPLAKTHYKPSSLPVVNANARSGASEGGSSEDEDDDDEETSTASHTQPAPSSSREEVVPEGTGSTLPGSSGNADEKTPVPFMDYVLNVMKCLDAILSNNSTDDHCREFVRQGGLNHLMSILTKESLPLDFPTSPACQATASVCRSILTLAHEEQVLATGLGALHKIMDLTNKLNETYPHPGSSVLLRELAESKSPPEAVNDAEQTPLLHRIISIHSMITMFINVCRTGQTDIRAMVVKHWGSDVGIDLLKSLSQLYLNLVWESTVLLSLCGGENQPGTAEFGRQDLRRLVPGKEKGLESQSTEPNVSNPSNAQADSMDVDQDMTVSPPVLVHSSTQTVQNQIKEIPGVTLQNYAKLIKPILSASSRLGRALTEFFGLLVKLCVGSPLRQRRGHHIPQLPGIPVAGALPVATTLSDLVTRALNWEPKENSPVPRITFSICAVGFSAPLLFDEKKFPYHLMLRKFMESDGLNALFKVFYWAIDPGQHTDEPPTISDHQLEFLESWLNLIEKFSNPKTILDNQHLNQTKSLMLSKSPEFDANIFLAHMHKKSFEAIMHLFNHYSAKDLGPRTVETLLTVLCHIFRFKGQVILAQIPKAPEEVQTTTITDQTSTTTTTEAAAAVTTTTTATNTNETTATATSEQQPAASSAGGGGVTLYNENGEPVTRRLESLGGYVRFPTTRDEAVELFGIDGSDLQQLMEMGFPLEMCVEALATTRNLLLATDYLLNSGISADPTAQSTPNLPPYGEARFTAFMRLLGAEDEGTEEDKVMTDQSSAPKVPVVAYKPLIENFEYLKAEEIDRFTETIFEMCLDVLHKTPDVVFRICELLVAVGQRNGMIWIEKIIRSLLAQVLDDLTKIMNHLRKDEVGGLMSATISTDASTFGHRLHLFTLLFGELTFLCAMIIEHTDLLPQSMHLIKLYESMLVKLSMDFAEEGGVMPKSAPAPPWMSPMILMLDLYQRAVVVSHRKAALAKETDFQWKWFDINSGKWSQYSQSNNSIINKAFWDGESTVRITAGSGKRRYVINFNAMIQLNEETSNRRPITLWLKDNNATSKPVDQEMASAITSDSDNEAVLRPSDSATSTLNNTSSRSKPKSARKCLAGKIERQVLESEMSYVRKKVDTFLGLTIQDIQELIRCSVSFIRYSREAEFLHAVMRLCLRLTRDHELAVMFANLGGVQLLLELTQKSNFPGVLPLSNLLIRHVIEDKGCLRYAVEKMIRAKILSTGASTCRELHYLLRVLAPIACRSPDLFMSVAKEILQVDLSFVTRREEDLRLIVKAMPCKQESFVTSMGDAAKKVIQQLLVALTLSNVCDVDAPPASEPSASTSKGTVPQAADTEESMELGAEALPVKTPKDKEQKATESNEALKNRRLIPKDAICQLLAESVHSYSYSCKIIAEYNFQGGISPYVPEDCTALAFLLDKLLPPNQNVSEKDCSTVVRDLISAMAGCNHLPDAQAIVVSEVKAALQRALAMRECLEKHNRIQALAGLICNMIEGCPSAPATQMVTIVKPTQLCMNQVVKLLIRKNVVVDLTRISHSLDLSSPQMAATINATLKPLEIISRIVNQPVPQNQHRPKPKTESTIHDSNATHTAGTSNSEMTHAQGEETVEDADNTEHDISAAAESILDATSESHTQHDGAEEREDDGLDDIMDQLLERDNTAQSEEQMIAEVLLNDPQNQRMETEQENVREPRDFNDTRFGDDHGDDSSDSDSEDSDGEDDEDEDDGNGNNVAEGDEEDEDDDEDDEDEDEEDAVSMDDADPFLHPAVDEGFMRLPGIDRDEDLLVVQYGHDENTPVFFTNNASYNFNVGLFDDPLISEHASGLRLNHPLLTPTTVDPPQTGSIVTRAHRAARNRRLQYVHLPRNPPPSIQRYNRPLSFLGRVNRQMELGNLRLLGPSTAHDAMQFTSGHTFAHSLFANPARVLMLDGTDATVARNGNNGTNSCLSNYTALHWWCEEAKVLDGESMHDCVIALKRPIVESIEAERDTLFQQRKEKKAKEAEEHRKKLEAATAAAKANMMAQAAKAATDAENRDNNMDVAASETGEARVGNVASSTPNESNTDQAGFNIIVNPADDSLPTNITFPSTDSSPREPPRQLVRGSPVGYGEPGGVDQSQFMDIAPEEPPPEPLPAILAATPRARLGRGRGRTPGGTQSGRGRRGLRSSARLAAASLREQQSSSGGGSRSSSSSAQLSQNASPQQPEQAEPQINQLSSAPASDPAPTIVSYDSDDDVPDLVPVARPNTAEETPQDEAGGNAGAEAAGSSAPPAVEPQSGAEPVPGPSGTQNMDDYRNILGDIDIPEGVDPSFLAALPEEMRQEVISEHLRQQRLRQRTTPPAETVSMADVSPDFLAALPPNIQEEVLAQQRIEQQRRVATASNPNDPVDTEAFFRNLQPQLRQAILADMEESQIAVLPPDLAAEAQNLRREWESRNRQLLHDRFFPQGALSSILRNSGVRITSRLGLQPIIHSRMHWSHFSRGPAAVAAQHMLMTSKIKGKQLVDNEALSCLLVLLFLDDHRLNTGRLHRVLRNLCYHANTRQWVIRSLLSVLERANECSRLPHQIALPAAKRPQEENSNEKTDKASGAVTPAWLNLSLDAALGCKASVFEIHKSPVPSGKKSCAETRAISIHSQAVPSISKHTLDVLSNLAKSFPTHFLPTKGKPSLYCHESSSKIYNIVERKGPISPPADSKSASTTKVTPTAVACTSKKSDVPEFWDILLKLDCATSSKKGKHVGKVHSNLNVSGIDQGTLPVPFEASPFGQLINMLAFGCIRRSTLLTDKLLRLLALISLGIPDTSGFGRKVILEEPETPVDSSLLITESHLRLIVEVITSKNCTEEGLEEATSLLLNLSYGPPTTRDKILSLLMEGVRDLGNVVCEHIASLQNELKQLRKEQTSEGSEEQPGPSTHTTDPDHERPFKGTLMDRFTKDTIVIQSASKTKPSYELQLPSMTALTSKTSSQSFFLRLLKVIINLRESIETAIKKIKSQNTGRSSAPISGPLMSSTVLTQADRDLINVQTQGLPEATAQRFREVIERAVQNTRMRINEEQPMDVDQDPPAEGEAARGEGAASGGRQRVESLLDMDDSSDEDEDIVLPMGGTEGENSGRQAPAPSSRTENQNIDISKLLPRLSSLLDLDKLWETLSECLLELGHTPDHHAVLVLQPAVEAFFLVHAASAEKDDKNTSRESREAQLAHLHQDLPPVSPIQASGENRLMETEMSDTSALLDASHSSTLLSSDTQKFLKFAETHRTVLNQILRQSSSNLAEGPFSVLVDHTRVLDFDVKRRYFRNELERLDEGVRREDLAVHVRRSHVFEDSFRELHRRAAEEWKNRFYIVFEGEEGQDAGGLLREWYVIISREIFNPMYALFTISPGDRVTYMINQLSHCNSNHLFYFKFVGRVIAKAIYDNKLLECYFTRSFYKHILGKPVRYTDMESEDYSFYQGLAFLMEHNVADLGYELTFSTEVQEFGVTEVRDLIPNGRNIPVSEDNKMEYIRLVCQMKMTGAIRKQLNAFLEGFYDIIPKRLISIFNEQELELLVSGLPNIDIEDLKANTEYHKYQVSSLQIQWFWRALRSFDQADRAKFLQFVTGTSKVPLQGFGSLEGMNGVQKFQIHRDDRSTDRLPSAHTCFNQLDLPAYETYDKLRSYLLKAIHECSEGFGFA